MEIKYKTQLSNLQKGGKPCYSVIILSNGTKTAKGCAAEIARLINMSVPFSRTAAGIVLDTMVEQAVEGYRIETENLSMYLSGRGSCKDPGEKWNPLKHQLHLVVNLKGELKAKMEANTFVNITEGVVVTLYSAGDEVYNQDGVIAGTAGTNVKLAGSGFLFDATKEDEGVWILDAGKAVLQKLNVTAKTDQTIDCNPTTAVAPGECYLMVASRNGEPDKGVAVAYRKVVVMGPKA